MWNKVVFKKKYHMAKSSKANAGKKSTGKRTLIAPKGNKRFVKRDAEGKFKESDDVGRSLSQDRKRTSKTKVKPGYGDQGDQVTKTSTKKGATKKAATKKAATKKAATKNAATKKAATKKAATKNAATKKAATKKAATKKAATRKTATKKSAARK